MLGPAFLGFSSDRLLFLFSVTLDPFLCDGRAYCLFDLFLKLKKKMLRLKFYGFGAIDNDTPSL